MVVSLVLWAMCGQRKEDQQCLSFTQMKRSYTDLCLFLWCRFLCLIFCFLHHPLPDAPPPPKIPLPEPTPLNPPPPPAPTPQSTEYCRQSAWLFLQPSELSLRRNWDPPPPLPQASVSPSREPKGGVTHSPAGEGGGAQFGLHSGTPGTLYKYFVLQPHWSQNLLNLPSVVYGLSSFIVYFFIPVFVHIFLSQLEGRSIRVVDEI